jgi:hypothetical protein
MLLIAQAFVVWMLAATPVRAAEPNPEQPQILWQNPADLEARNLFYGIGGKTDTPPPGQFEFVKEDLSGSNPKMTVRDAGGKKWKVKLGAEAKPETVATRFVWAVGYTTDEDYYVEDSRVVEVPSKLKRLKGAFGKDGTIHGARYELEDKDVKKDGEWRWKKDAFSGSRELNGLRTLMALLNNWDLKNENNSIYVVKTSKDRLYVVSDLGASFGTSNLVPGHSKSRGNIISYEHSRFITKKTADTVNFATPGRPALLMIFNPAAFFHRVRLESIGHEIPRTDAKWMGSLLARLSPEQVRDAFRAGGYSPQDVESYARIVEKRIAELNAL